MCGIAGFCGKIDKQINNWEEQILKMNARMEHRGPDAGGIWRSDDGKVVFGHRRLSIMDLSPGGAQPMLSHSGRFVIAYNGEIYNHPEIRSRLLADGFCREFRGGSDTEILLEAFEAYGIDRTLDMVRGMFAIALYDNREHALYLMRDRVGQKPLYYGFVSDGNGGRIFVFASEIGCIRTMEHFDNRINTAVLDIYFTHGYIPAPYTIYEDVYKLEAGYCLKLAEPFSEPEYKQYWSMAEVAAAGQRNLFRGSEEEAACELERLLRKSIRGQMLADVPVGAFLSAGIDSSTIVSLMQSESEKPVKTFTIGMNEEGFNEAEIAGEIAGILGTEHTERYISIEDAKAVIPRLAYMFGEPFADSSQIPTTLVSAITREKVTVSLSGDAGDELFCGYNMYSSVERVWNKIKRIPFFIRRPASSIWLALPCFQDHVGQTKGMLLGAKDPARLYELDNKQEPLAERIALDKGGLPYKYSQYKYGQIKDLNHNIMLMDLLMYHPDDILAKVDRAAMSVSLETRIPLLDRDVVEFAWTLPLDYKKKDGVTKRVLRKILYRYVPEELINRPKTGFSIPIHKWLLEGDLRDWAEDLMDISRIRADGILNADHVEQVWREYTQQGVWRPLVWYILMFQQWYRTAC